MICPYCKETIQDGAIKCRYCGSLLNLDSANTINIDNIGSDEIREFVGPNSHYYIQNFSKFTITGREKFAATWNWSCFAFTFIWMLYRKMYLLALITFVIFCIPGVNILLHIGAGITGNYLYYRFVKDQIREIKSTQTSQNNYLPLLQELGGVNKWVVSLGIIIGIIVAILFALFFSTMIASISHFVRITI